MISIKYDFPPPTGARASSSSRGPLSTSVVLFAPASSLAPLSVSLPSLTLPPVRPPPLPAGVTQGLTHSLIISSQCTVRNSLVTRTRTHVHRGPAPPPPPHLPPLTPFSCSRSLARSRWRSPIIRFHRIFVVRAQASGPDTNPPINPVSVWGIRN